MTIVLDTNIWVSLALNQQLDFIANINSLGIVIISCDELINELADVLSRPKFKKHFTLNFIEKVSKFHKQATSKFDISVIESVVADQNDDYLFALCKITNADYLVTGDKLLLEVKKYRNTSVITLADFKSIISS